jgi:Rieske Fe-S protein
MTELPQIEDAWIYEAGALTLDMTRLPELDAMGGAVRIEGDILTDPILVFQGDDGEFYALKNVCTHAGRKIDPIAGTMTLECCSASQSTYDYQGNVLSGPAERPLTIYPVTLENDQLIIQIG